MAPSGRAARLLVCGGAAVDHIVKPFDESQRGASRTSMPGSLTVSQGGVGRNIAEVVAKLGGQPTLLSAVGTDGAGSQLLVASESLGIEVGSVARLEGCRTATFTALLDGTGELVGAVADMDIFDEIKPDTVRAAFAQLSGVDLVVCDANLPSSTLDELLRLCAERSLPAWFEPVSVGKALKGRCSKPWHLVTPNWDELLILLDRVPVPFPDSGDSSRLPDAVTEVLGSIASSSLAENVLVTMGSHGAVLASSSQASSAQASVPGIYDLSMESLLSGIAAAPAGIPNLTLLIEPLSGVPGDPLWYRLLRPLEHVRDSTGAGDALVAGTASAFALGWPLAEAVVAGLVCAHLTLFVDGAVAHFFDHELLSRLHREAKFSQAADIRSRL